MKSHHSLWVRFFLFKVLAGAAENSVNSIKNKVLAEIFKTNYGLTCKLVKFYTVQLRICTTHSLNCLRVKRDLIMQIKLREIWTGQMISAFLIKVVNFYLQNLNHVILESAERISLLNKHGRNLSVNTNHNGMIPNYFNTPKIRRVELSPGKLVIPKHL